MSPGSAWSRASWKSALAPTTITLPPVGGAYVVSRKTSGSAGRICAAARAATRNTRTRARARLRPTSAVRGRAGIGPSSYRQASRGPVNWSTTRQKLSGDCAVVLDRRERACRNTRAQLSGSGLDSLSRKPDFVVAARRSEVVARLHTRDDLRYLPSY